MVDESSDILESGPIRKKKLIILIFFFYFLFRHVLKLPLKHVVQVGGRLFSKGVIATFWGDMILSLKKKKAYSWYFTFVKSEEQLQPGSEI